MYRTIRFIAKVIVKLLFGLKVKGTENIPATGSGIVAANHVSLVDPIAVASVIKRPICFMAKSELFSNAFLDWFFRAIKTFPVRRGQADRNAIRTGLDLLANGELVGIFPEGTRSHDSDQLLPIQSGAALLSIKSGAPIIPVVVKETDSLKLRKNILVIIGKPIHPIEGKRVTKEELNRVNNMILQQLTWLNKQDF